MTDPIADMLTRIRNAQMGRHESVEMPASRLKLDVLRILKDEGYIKDFRVKREATRQNVRVWLKYADKEPVLSGLKRISKPGCRVYVGKDNIPKVLSGMGVAVLSTSHGVITGRQARRLGVGGEVLCFAW
ncbi:MAG: 30S ribosomal protein S8 [Chloroflexi bacterium]|nr:30S ribosomal protein S8 [Chloroflexota bacterium]MBU1750905.1 30S ribosomal protein S8 [Chloroflexota bacterium]MBU1879648.1 30S ribosomal protein S8 [Chloroflexota bacterium]